MVYQEYFTSPHLCSSGSLTPRPPDTCELLTMWHQQPHSTRGLGRAPSSELTCKSLGRWLHSCTLEFDRRHTHKVLPLPIEIRWNNLFLNYPRKSDSSYRKFPRMAFWEQTKSLLRKKHCSHKRTATQRSLKLFPLQDWYHQVGQ